MEKQIGTSNLIHGQGSMFGEVSGLGGNKMPWFIEKRGDQFCVVKGTREDPIETEKCHDSNDEAKAHLAALHASEAKDEHGDDEHKPKPRHPQKSRFFTYKAADGTRRWVSISSVAIKDKEFEIVTEKAYDDAIEHARDTSNFGELDLVHVEGTDVGDCDLMMRVGNRLIEGGTFRDTPLAKGAIRGVEDDPDYWGTSIKFVFDPSKFDGEKYHGNIRIRKRTILPQEMAASFGTKFVAMNGGSKMQEELGAKAREALEKLNVSEEKIEALAEKKIEVEVEPNTVAKTAVPEPKGETVEAKKQSVWARLKDAAQALLAVEPDAATGGEETTEEVEKPVVPQADTEQADMTETIKALTVAISAPLITEIATLSKNVATMEARLKEAEQAVEDKFLLKLVEAPPVVTVRASQVKATAIEAEPIRGPVFPNENTPQDDYAAKLFEGVTQAVEAGVGAALSGKVAI